MATYIETKDIRLFIDPGVSLAPRRYGLPPHPKEIDLMDKVWKEIVSYASKSDVIVITHYHYDHYNPRRDLDIIYDGKEIFLKDYNNYINQSQMKRSQLFIRNLKDIGIDRNINIADSKTVYYGDTMVKFSPPFPHGIDDRLGYVVMVYVKEGEDSILYTSDVEGPFYSNIVDYILEVDPKVLILDGPATYLRNKFPSEYMEEAIANINRIILFSNNLSKLIIDHHFMRDREYMQWLRKLWSEYSLGNYINIMSVAEFMGRRLNMLEAYRDVLYEKSGELNE